MLCGFQSKATRTPEKVGEEELFVKYPTGWKRVGFAKDPLTVTTQSLMNFGAGDNVSKPWVISGKLSKRVARPTSFSSAAFAALSVFTSAQILVYPTLHAAHLMFLSFLPRARNVN